MIVLDASATLELVLGTEIGRGVEERLARGRPALQAPHLIDLEVVQVLRRLTLRDRVTLERAQEGLASFGNLRIDRYPHEPLLPRIWALRHNLSAYDAAYVALAEALDAPLITRDRRIADAPGHTARVEVF